MISLAIAMGVGRFAFTPMFPLMLRDGLLNNADGTLLATSNYLGYVLGAMLAGRIKTKPSLLLVFGLVGTRRSQEQLAVLLRYSFGHCFVWLPAS